MRYLVDGLEVDKIDFEEMLENALHNYVEDVFDETVDENEGEIEIMGYRYYASTILKLVDGVAYHESRNGFLDSVKVETDIELDRGHEVELDGITFQMEEE